MNERIKELEKQCWSHYVNGVLIDGHLHFDAEKFAQLIVKECINSLGSQTDQSNLRRKFGIAEPTVEGIGRYYPPSDFDSAETQYNRPAKVEKITELKNKTVG